MNEKPKSTKDIDKKTYIIAQEIKLAKILAGNNKTLRDRALKRLKRWFQFRSQSCPFTENDFMRIWKGLFYTMWMSDKPLIQEECAEMIASLVHFTTVNYSLMFFKCGLQTLGNEWFGIDQLRLDKFLMFVRRLLRQGFVILSKDSWTLKTIKEFNNILSSTVLNTENAPPLSLTLHFTEIYLEELAKVSEGNLKPNLITEFVSPFVKQLALLNDKRQITCILKNIFRYLMRQSDIGVEYEEKYKAWKREGFPGNSIDAMQKEVLSDDEKMSDEDDEKDRKQNNEKILDPRAGHVDVVLPQLKFIPKQIIEILRQNKFLDGSSKQSRKAISTAIEEFTQLSKGEYPLGIKKLNIPKYDGYSTRIKNAVNRLVKFEGKLLNKAKKRQKHNNNGMTELIVKKQRSNSQTDNEEFNEKLAEFIKKSENNIKLKETNDKVNTTVLQSTKKGNEKKKKVKKNARDAHSDLTKSKLKKIEPDSIQKNKIQIKKKMVKEKLNMINKDGKKIKSTKAKVSFKKGNVKSAGKKSLDKKYECTFERNSGTWFVYDDDDSSSTSSLFDTTLDAMNTSSGITPDKTGNALAKDDFTSADIHVGQEFNLPSPKSLKEEVSNTSTPSPPQLNKLKSDEFQQEEWDVPLKEGGVELFVESKISKKKMSKLSSSLVQVGNITRSKLPRRRSLESIVKNPFARLSTPGSSKKVKIALNLNKAQDIREHVAQIKSSPGIPFDANKKPSKPLLKSHTTSPIDPFYVRKIKL